jgi:hypothetical protein
VQVGPRWPWFLYVQFELRDLFVKIVIMNGDQYVTGIYRKRDLYDEQQRRSPGQYMCSYRFHCDKAFVNRDVSSTAPVGGTIFNCVRNGRRNFLDR